MFSTTLSYKVWWGRYRATYPIFFMPRKNPCRGGFTVDRGFYGLYPIKEFTPLLYQTRDHKSMYLQKNISCLFSFRQRSKDRFYDS